MTTPLKKCTKCGEEKPATREYFSKCSKVKDGLTSMCTPCHRAYQRDWAKTNYVKNADVLKRKARERNKTHRHQHNEAIKRWRKKNPEKAKEFSSRYYYSHKEDLNKKAREKQKVDTENISVRYIKNLLRARVSDLDAVPPDLIELKRIEVLLKRIKRERKNEQSTNPRGTLECSKISK